VRHSKYQQPSTILESRADAAAGLKNVLATVPSRLSAISDHDASQPRIVGKWSCKQILGHLIDSAANNHHRFVRAQIEKSLEMPGYTQNEWVSTQLYQQRNWIGLVTLWTTYNEHILHLILTAPADHLTIPCKIAGDESGPLEFLMVDYVAHLEHHLNQILATPEA
jgi:DinB superfamily